MAPEPATLLELKNWSLVRCHGGQEITLLDNINLRLNAGRWLAVLGANGSGKSSLLKYLASEESPLVEETAIMFQDPDDQIIASTVNRELTLGRENLQPGPLLAEFSLQGLGELDPRLLSAGQKQRLVMAVALAGKPQVLLADEPTALQDRHQAAWILQQLGQWLDHSGRTLITATCDRREAILAHEILVLDQGHVVLHGPTRELLDDPRVVALLGDGKQDPSVPLHWDFSADAPDPVLNIKQLTCSFVGPGGGFHIPQINLQPGGRLGITGSNGCGKSTLLAACAGVRKPNSGKITLAGHQLYSQQKNLDLDHGLAMLAPQFPEYLFTRETVAKEIAVDPALKTYSATDFLEKVGLDPALVDRNPHSLSSGQRRRLALGMVLFSGRPLLLLDEPTAALDRQGRQRVLELLADLPAEAILIVASHDREFLSAAGCPILNLDDHSLDS